MIIKKNYLLTPGPVAVPEDILLKASKAIIHHRTPQFSEIFVDSAVGLKEIFKTTRDIFIYTASGTGAMESAVVNILSPGDKVAVVRGGKFGDRWGEICSKYGVDVVNIDIEWGDAPTVEQIKEVIESNPGIKSVYTTLSETSTGTVYDIKSIGEYIKSTDAILVVDAVSGIAGTEYEMDAWNVDITVCGSQKGLMLPPGLAFAAVSEKAWQLVESSTLPKYYWDYKSMKKSLEKKTTPYTPAVSLVIQLNQSLKMIKEIGLENFIKNAQILAGAAREAAGSLGLKLLSRYPGNICTAIKLPDGVDGKALVKYMRDDLGVAVAGGQADLMGKIIRISHIGYVNEFDTISAFAAFEAGLKKFGYDLTSGTGVNKVMELLLG